jgi:hypothetical protein
LVQSQSRTLTVFATAITLEDEAIGRRPAGNGHLLGPYRQIKLHTVAASPADYSAGMQVQDYF